MDTILKAIEAFINGLVDKRVAERLAEQAAQAAQTESPVVTRGQIESAVESYFDDPENAEKLIQIMVDDIDGHGNLRSEVDVAIDAKLEDVDINDLYDKIRRVICNDLTFRVSVD